MNDALSRFFSTVRIETVLSARVEVRGEWGARYPCYRHMKFGSLLEGERWIWVDSEPPIHMRSGDFYLLTDGRPYCSATSLNAPLVDGAAALAPLGNQSGTMEIGSGPVSSVAIGGRFTLSDDDMAGQLRFLPPLIHITRSEDLDGRLKTILAMIAEETTRMSPGSTFAVSNLANLVLIRILRIYSKRVDISPSWLCGSLDPKIAVALSLLHQQPERRWTIEELARSVGLSRSALAERFARKVGQPPMAYLSQWRMLLARSALRRGEPIATLADKLGFGSATAFSIAFKRETGENPGRYRAAMTQQMGTKR